MEIPLESAPLDSQASIKFLAVGKIIADKVLNRKGVLTILRNIWQEDKVFCIRDLGDNRYSIAFRSEELRRKATDDGPWSVMGYSVGFQLWKEEWSLEDINFTEIVFWTQVHNLPLEMLTKRNAELIGERLGRVLEVEDPQHVVGGREFLRVKISMKADEPLVDGFWVPRKNQARSWALLRYERLSDLCFSCGRLGHLGKNCQFCEANEGTGEQKQRYGVFMKAGTPRQELPATKEPNQRKHYPQSGIRDTESTMALETGKKAEEMHAGQVSTEKKLHSRAVEIPPYNQVNHNLGSLTKEAENPPNPNPELNGTFLSPPNTKPPTFSKGAPELPLPRQIHLSLQQTISNANIPITIPRPEFIDKPRDPCPSRKNLSLTNSQHTSSHQSKPSIPYYVEFPSDEDNTEFETEGKIAGTKVATVPLDGKEKENHKEGELSVFFIEKLNLKRSREELEEETKQRKLSTSKKQKSGNLEINKENQVKASEVKGIMRDTSFNLGRRQKAAKVGYRKCNRAKREALAVLNGLDLLEVPIQISGETDATKLHVSDIHSKGGGGWPKTATSQP